MRSEEMEAGRGGNYCNASPTEASADPTKSSGALVTSVPFRLGLDRQASEPLSLRASEPLKPCMDKLPGCELLQELT